MPPRSIWSGSISFGLVNVPVKLTTAVSPKDVRFNQLHDADGARISQKRVCSLDGEEEPFENIVKGYEVAPNQYVIIEWLAAKFDPDKFVDEYREQVMGLIEQKAAGMEIVAQPVTEAPAAVVDLMAALEASLAEAKARPSGDGAAAKPAKAKASAKA